MDDEEIAVLSKIVIEFIPAETGSNSKLGAARIDYLLPPLRKLFRNRKFFCISLFKDVNVCALADSNRERSQLRSVRLEWGGIEGDR